MQIIEKDAGTQLPLGLTDEQVAAEVAAGRVNVIKEKAGKSYGRIIADNLLTFFNLNMSKSKKSLFRLDIMKKKKTFFPMLYLNKWLKTSSNGERLKKKVWIEI